MPRFPPKTEAALKEAMLARGPARGFFDTTEDVPRIAQATGLSAEQIVEWAHHFRMRVPEEDRELVLQCVTVDDEDTVMAVRRGLITLFGVNHSIITSPSFVKRGGAGVYPLRAWVVSYNTTTTEARIYFEFDDQIRAHIMKQLLSEAGAGSVNIDSFPRGDAIAISALTHVHATAAKPGWQMHAIGEPKVKPRALAPSAAAGSAEPKELQAVLSGQQALAGVVTEQIAPAIAASVSNAAALRVSQDEVAHLKKMTHRLRGTMGAAARKNYKPLRAEIASIKAERDRAQAERDRAQADHAKAQAELSAATAANNQAMATIAALVART